MECHHDRLARPIRPVLNSVTGNECHKVRSEVRMARVGLLCNFYSIIKYFIVSKPDMDIHMVQIKKFDTKKLQDKSVASMRTPMQRASKEAPT